MTSAVRGFISHAGFAFEAMVEHDAGDREAALRALAAARAIEAVPTASAER